MGWVDTTKYLARFHQDCVSHCKSVAFQGRINAFFYIVLKDTQIMLYPMWNQQLKSEIMPSPKGRRLSCKPSLFTGETSVLFMQFLPRENGNEEWCNSTRVTWLPAMLPGPTGGTFDHWHRHLSFFCEFGFRGESLARGNPLRSRSYPNQWFLGES